MFLQLQGGDPIPLCRVKEGERLRSSEGMEPREGACAQEEVEGGKQEKEWKISKRGGGRCACKRANAVRETIRQRDNQTNSICEYKKYSVVFVKKFSEVVVLTCVNQSENILPSSVMAAI